MPQLRCVVCAVCFSYEMSVCSMLQLWDVCVQYASAMRCVCAVCFSHEMCVCSMLQLWGVCVCSMLQLWDVWVCAVCFSYEMCVGVCSMLQLWDVCAVCFSMYESLFSDHQVVVWWAHQLVGGSTEPSRLGGGKLDNIHLIDILVCGSISRMPDLFVLFWQVGTNGSVTRLL
jgi:hypothetical protein